MQQIGKRGRIAAVAAGVGFVAVLALAAVFRNEIEAWYHLERLKRDPGYFMTIAGEAEATPERLACERFMDRQDGKLTLLRELAKNVAKHVQRYGMQPPADYYLEQNSSRVTFWMVMGGAGGMEGSVEMAFDVHELFGKKSRVILDWLPALQGRDYVLPEDPTMVYEISNPFGGRIGIHARKNVPEAVTPPPGPPASTPPSPPSTGTSGG